MTTKTKQKNTKDAPSEVDAFIQEVQGENPARTGEDLPTVRFERDELHTMTVTEWNAFEGQYGPSVCVIGEDDEGTRIKTFFGGFEREAFLRFAEGQEFPVQVRLVRKLMDSEQNPGRSYAALFIKADV